MKTVKIILAGVLLFLAGALQSQVAVTLSIGSPPPWGPAGYVDVHYYYLPDLQAYYDVEASMFIKNYRGNWIHRSYLPGRYRDYDLYNGYKVVLTDYHGLTPYVLFLQHKKQYGRGYHGQHQKTIGERPGTGNSVEKRHNTGNMNKKANHQGSGKAARHGNNNKMQKGHGGKKGGNK